MRQMQKSQKEEGEYKSVLVIVTGFLVLYVVTPVGLFLYISLGVGVACLCSGSLRNVILYGWETLAMVLGWINSQILLTILFFVFLLPVAAMRRLFQRNRLELKRKEGSMYYDREHLYTREDLEQTF